KTIDRARATAPAARCKSKPCSCYLGSPRIYGEVRWPVRRRPSLCTSVATICELRFHVVTSAWRTRVPAKNDVRSATRLRPDATPLLPPGLRHLGRVCKG